LGDSRLGKDGEEIVLGLEVDEIERASERRGVGLFIADINLLVLHEFVEALGKVRGTD
jgi:hypothetical protein